MKNIIHICEEINRYGGEVIFTGTNYIEELGDRNYVNFLNKLKITREENELLQLFVWSKASFFVGNLSGGTIPPSLFGTPVFGLMFILLLMSENHLSKIQQYQKEYLMLKIKNSYHLMRQILINILNVRLSLII